MVAIGKYNQLSVSKLDTMGVFLDGGSFGEILLPKRFTPEGVEIGDRLNIFIYLDSEDRLIATTQTPKAQVGEVAWLQVTAVNQVGAFLDWGLSKDLLVPFSEQRVTMEEGQYYLVMLFLDQINRIASSSRIESFLKDEVESEDEFQVGQEVSLVIADKTELGIKAVVNHSHFGLLYEDELLQKVKRGQKFKGFIKKIRTDNKIDLSLQPVGYHKKRMNDFSDILLEKIRSQEGFLPLHDKSPAEEIYATFNVSKKIFKQGVGKLYKQRLITIEKTGLRLIANNDEH